MEASRLPVVLENGIAAILVKWLNDLSPVERPINGGHTTHSSLPLSPKPFSTLNGEPLKLSRSAAESHKKLFNKKLKILARFSLESLCVHGEGKILIKSIEKEILMKGRKNFQFFFRFLKNIIPRKQSTLNGVLSCFIKANARRRASVRQI